MYTGGTVFHSFLGESVPDIKALRSFIVKALSETKIPYISVTPTFSICNNHGYLTGDVRSAWDAVAARAQIALAPDPALAPGDHRITEES